MTEGRKYITGKRLAGLLAGAATFVSGACNRVEISGTAPQSISASEDTDLKASPPVQGIYGLSKSVVDIYAGLDGKAVTFAGQVDAKNELDSLKIRFTDLSLEEQKAVLALLGDDLKNTPNMKALRFIHSELDETHKFSSTCNMTIGSR